ncbi:methyltransferase family protein [Natronorubrum daqingense]|uniref:Protein-S-isoprenylcysteine O-methyltransferase Ste14 n=1 Tax=Natronorubrum daqingense TaxID=588898 RepID=A0A1N7ES94_9EURY|nr:isoprenylcysteine carboxylmethyltransferase family protein [Natronorubrum daqingense]APX97750.1 protein-S-isoprenylcysteine methyltransferase [Natronorubrum daqingense]SIR90927.1 Protein-S-isoprenylcysteine O-methyltransferase Ste14 [Natronorubrum daqingense]
MTSIRTAAKTVLFTILVPGTLAVAIPQLLAKWRPHPRLPVNSSVANLVGTLSIGSGILLYLHTAHEFLAAGDGTPSPSDEPDELVTSGVYARSRNPMYVGVLLVIAGQALRRRSVSILWWAAGCWIGFHNRIIRYEEPHLAEKHGDEYEQYRDQVPRWFSRR